MSRLKLLLPLFIFIGLALVFWLVLKREGYDPQYLPSALIDKPVPAFELPVVSDSNKRLTLDDMPHQVYLLNVWATWCITCRVEHRYLDQLASDGVNIIGVNYKDDRDKALKWLQDLGNPYRFVLFDADGRFGLDLGVYGAPETYVIDAQGYIRYKKVGIVDDREWAVMGPVYDRLVAEAQAGDSDA